MEKIVDASGHNAGYATFVELMAQQAEDLKRLKIFLGHEVVGWWWWGDGTGIYGDGVGIRYGGGGKMAWTYERY